MNGIHSFRLNGDPLREDPLMMGSRSGSGCSLYRHRSLDNSYFPSKVGNSSMSSNTSRKVNNNNNHHHHTRSKSRESCDFMPTPSSCYSSGSFRMNPHIQSTNASGRRSGTPIMYSSSSGMLKPPPIEKKLECTLEELCYGCKKKVKITRDVLTDTGCVFIHPHMHHLIFDWCCFFFFFCFSLNKTISMVSQKILEGFDTFFYVDQ